MKLVTTIRVDDVRCHLARHGNGVTVNLTHFFKRHRVFRRIKIGRIGEQKAQRVADTAIGLGHAFQDFVGQRKLTRIIRRGDPQPQNVRAQRVTYLLRRDDVAERFAHLATVLIDHKTVRQQLVIGRATIDHAARQQ